MCGEALELAQNMRPKTIMSMYMGTIEVIRIASSGCVRVWDLGVGASYITYMSLDVRGAGVWSLVATLNLLPIN